MKTLLAVVVSVLSFAGLAESERSGARGWTLTVGPAWRARVKSSISGTGRVPGVSPSHSVVYDKDIAGHGPWSVGEVEKVPDPDYPADPTFQKYAATRTATTTTVTPYSNDAALGGSDADRPLGLRAIVGYDFYATERFSLGLGLKFAAYWNMRSSASGHAGGGSISVHRTKDYYLFNNGPIPDDTDFTSFYPDTDPYLPYQENEELPSEQIAGSFINARIRSDLYQIGIGPQATWHAFDWLDFYGRVEALCNIAHMNFEVGPDDSTDTKCLFGFGGTLGCAAFFTENFGLYAECGYEWVDKAETDLGRARADVDFSSFIISTGAIVRF